MRYRRSDVQELAEELRGKNLSEDYRVFGSRRAFTTQTVPRDFPDNWAQRSFAGGDPDDLVAISNTRVSREEMLGVEDADEDVADMHGGEFAVRVLLPPDRAPTPEEVEDDPESVYTPAFRKLCELIASFEAYPLLDDDDYSNLEMEHLHEALRDNSRRFVRDGIEEKEWMGALYAWFSAYREGELDNEDGSGAYPDEEWIKIALYDADLIDEDRRDETEAMIHALGGPMLLADTKPIDLPAHRARLLPVADDLVEGLLVSGRLVAVSSNEVRCRICSEVFHTGTVEGSWIYAERTPSARRGNLAQPALRWLGASDLCRDTFAHLRCLGLRLDLDAWREDARRYEFTSWQRRW